jgi:hypothetical protein
VAGAGSRRRKKKPPASAATSAAKNKSGAVQPVRSRPRCRDTSELVETCPDSEPGAPGNPKRGENVFAEELGSTGREEPTVG